MKKGVFIAVVHIQYLSRNKDENQSTYISAIKKANRDIRFFCWDHSVFCFPLVVGYPC